MAGAYSRSLGTEPAQNTLEEQALSIGHGTPQLSREEKGVLVSDGHECSVFSSSRDVFNVARNTYDRWLQWLNWCQMSYGSVRSLWFPT